MNYYGNQVYNRNDVLHWKYIKRERINGKWRYYYHDPEYRSALNNYNSAKSRTTEISLKRAASKADYDQAYMRTLNDWKRSKDGKEYIWTATPQARRNHRLEDEARQEYLKYDQRFRVAQMAESIARKKYIKTKLSSIPRRTIAKGAAIVANFLSKYSK